MSTIHSEPTKDQPLIANFGEYTLFAYAGRNNLDASHKREEIETDCIGVYYLAVGEAPLAQFGHTEDL